MSNRNPYDESDYAAFRDNESRIKIDDREMDELDNEFSPDQLDENMFIMQDDET